MNSSKLEKVFHADEQNFYDTRDMAFEMDSEAATDDYGLNRVPGNWRFSPWQAFWSLSGIPTGLAFPLTGALLTLSFGAPATIIGFLITGIIVSFGIYYASKQASNEGIGKDLMTRASLGYYGSIVTSLFSALFFVLMFSVELTVLANSLSEYVPILPYWVSAALIVAVFVLLGIYGMVLINKLQNFTLWLYAIGLILGFVGLFYGWSDKASVDFAGDWWKANPSGAPLSFTTVLSATGSWIGAFGLVSIWASTDVTRMVRRKEQKKGAVLSSIILGVFGCVIAGMLGIFLLASTQFTNPDPGVTFVRLLGPFGLFFIIITQLRINIMNMYLGTLAFDSSVAQVSNKGVARSWLLVPFAIIGYIIVIIPGFMGYFPTLASMASVLFAAWVGAVFGEKMLVRRRYGIPSWSEFRRAYLPAVNWIGFASFLFPTILGLAGVIGLFGDSFKATAVPVTFVGSFFLPAILAMLLGKEKVVRQYFARIPEIPESDSDMMDCAITGETLHRSDFVLCPFHNNTWISSKACASESNCGKMCQFMNIPKDLPQQKEA